MKVKLTSLFDYILITNLHNILMLYDFCGLILNHYFYSVVIEDQKMSGSLLLPGIRHYSTND